MRLQKGDVTVRLFEEDDIPYKVEWINNPDNNTFLHYDLPLEYEKTLKWFRSKDKTGRIDCVIEFSGIPVGLVGLLSIDNLNRKAEFYISMGETAYKQKGIATMATELIVDYGFEKLGLHKIYLNVDSDNVIACRLYEKVGFTCEGVFVDDMFHRGRFINRKRYALIRNRF